MQNSDIKSSLWRSRVFWLKLLLIVGVGIAVIVTMGGEQLFGEHKEIFSRYNYVAFMLASASMGVIFAASMYNLAFYLYNRDSRYLYYTLGQLSILLFLISLDSLHIYPFTEFFKLDNVAVMDLALQLMVIFSLLFIAAFLSLPVSHPLFFIIKAVIVVMGIDIVAVAFFGHGVLIRIIPPFVWIWLVISESGRLYRHKDRSYSVLYWGWYFVIIMGILVYTDLVAYLDGQFPWMHITFAIEAIVMSLAISYRVSLVQKEKEMQRRLMLRQSRLASMGEMVTVIAHQWKQPLARLGYLMMHLKRALSDDGEALQKVHSANAQIRYMSETIETFRSFYSASKRREQFSVLEAAEETLSIASVGDVQTQIITQNDFTLEGSRSEFQQALLNIIHNAAEALKTRAVEKGRITILIDEPYVQICDNAGGIAPRYRDKIFTSSFSTNSDGEGLGLYIVKMVIEKEFGGRIEYRYGEESCFLLSFD